MVERNSKGLVHVYTGDGKGKTTAALGLALRAAGHGMRVLFLQFLKGQQCGEHLFVAKYHPFDIIQTGTGNLFTKPREQLRQEVQDTLALAKREVLGGKYDLVVLDEIFVALDQGYLTVSQVLELIEEKPGTTELVMTGRKAPPEIVQRADLVTEMLMIKHPFTEGFGARRGIDY